MYYRDIPEAERGTIIDVRSEEEFELMHAEGSVNIPADLIPYYLDELKELPPPWIFCSEKGVRSGRIALLLKMIGFDQVYNGGQWLDIDKARRTAPAA